MTQNIYVRGTQTTRGDLALFTVDNANQPVNVAEISYALYDASSGVEVLLGSPARAPINPAVGEYYAAFFIPANAEPGLYRLRWRFRETLSSPEVTVLEEFYVVEARETSPLELYSAGTLFMLRRLRISLRDQNPDRNYRFRPPTHEGTINQFTRVFGYIWEDHELVEFLDRGVDYVNLIPPLTGFTGLDGMIRARPAWREMVIYAAMANALMAISINWTAEEFSYSIGGISLDISKASQYESLKGNAESQLDKLAEFKTRTEKYTYGLQQSRYGVGVRSAMGPATGRSTITPRKYLGF